MAESTVRQRVGARGAYYTPTLIAPVAGLEVESLHSTRYARYFGTAEQLAQSGVISADYLPGAPGRPLHSACYRPIGEEKRSGEGWYEVPGYLYIARRKGGDKFEVFLTVSREEQARRTAEGKSQVRDEERQHQANSTSKVLNDPTVRVARYVAAGFADTLGALPVGAKVVVRGEEKEVQVVEPFGPWNVDGEWRLGYVAKTAEGNRYFYSAGQLSHFDCKPAHLRLVWSAGAAVP